MMFEKIPVDWRSEFKHLLYAVLFLCGLFIVLLFCEVYLFFKLYLVLRLH